MKNNISGFYRLRQIDFGGQFEYSGIINISQEVVHQGEWGKLFPNPAQEYLYTDNPDIERIDIYNLNNLTRRLIGSLKV